MKLSENLAITATVGIVAGVLVLASWVNTSVNAERTEITSSSTNNTNSQSPNEVATSDDSALPSVETPEAGQLVKFGDMLQLVVVAEEAESDTYDRKEFKHWTGAEGSDCDARDAVLKEESNPPLPAEAACPFNTGKWISLYDGKLITDPGKLDIDHMVPLAEAWRSGAYAWDSETREQYANDRGDARSLIAVSAGSNRSKSDQDPDEWLPTDDTYLCTYLADWIAVKYRWDLTMDSEERSAVASFAEDCSETVIEVPVKANKG